MNHDEEIEYRNSLMSRLYKGEKISSEERLWLHTHSIYHWKMGYPYLKADVLSLKAKQMYRFHVTVEKLTYEKRIIPIISVPVGKGSIYTDFAIMDSYGNDKSGNPVRILGITINKEYQKTSFLYRSNTGLVMVTYACDYYDEKHQRLLSDTSDSGSSRLAMLKEIVSENKVRYQCKSPISDSFDSLAFSVTWEPHTCGRTGVFLRQGLEICPESILTFDHP